MRLSSSLVLTALVTTGCADMGYGGQAGITPGGSQDIGLARDLIEAGQIPRSDQFTAEGLFSEHDLPLDGDPCADVLCPRAAATVHRPLDGRDDRMLLQLGFGSNVDLATFTREDLDVVALVDTSCSMTGDNLDIAIDGLLLMIEQLGPDDHMALVEFGSRPKLLQARRAMDADGVDKLRKAVEGLHTDGSTDLESGMRVAYAQLSPEEAGSHRLMVFTDAQPNTGVTEQGEFVQLVREQAAAGVGTTLFGTGTDLGSELADAMSKVRGGSTHYLGKGQVRRLFSDEFDLIVTPVAYDLDVRVIARTGLAIDEVYGAPVDGGEVRFGASTLFLSTRRGGIGATFPIVPEEGVDELALAELAVSWVDLDGQAMDAGLSAAWHGGTFLDESDGLGVHKMGVLVDEYLAMTAASALCTSEGSADDPSEVLQATIDRLEATGLALEDAPISAEADLMRKLLENVALGPDACASEYYGY